MPFTVNYEVLMPYRALPGLGLQPAVEVRLHLGGREARAPGIFDSGSVWTVFGEEIARLLGIANIADGDAVRASTFGGEITLYRFPVELEVAVDGIRDSFPGQVCFRPGRTSRNILGRDLFFPHFQIGFRDARQSIYLSSEP
jgi:hypothetical protein